MRRLLIVVGIVAVLGTLFAFGTFTPRNDRDVASPRLGRAMPDFEMPLFTRYQDAYGETFRLSEYLGETPIVVNFWASWCGPCYDEAPHLERTWQRYQDRVLFVGVDTQDRGNEAAARAFLDRFNLSFPNGIDGDSRIGIEFGLFGVPETFFIRADGTLSYKHVGPVTVELMEEKIEAMLQ